MRIVRDVLTLGLVTSALLGLLILTTDQWLWIAEPSHAYGLIGFVILDILLTIVVLETPSVGIWAAAVASILQLTVMVGDMFVGQPVGISSTAFRAYLINDPSYIGILLVKTIIVAVAFASMAKPFVQRHPHLTRSLHNPRA